jgi:transposase
LIQKEGLSPPDQLLQHQTHSGPAMVELESWARKQLDENLVELNSGVGKAIKYLLKHWPKLTCFLRVPGSPLDNNVCERVLKHAILSSWHRKKKEENRSLAGFFSGAPGLLLNRSKW